MQISDQLGAALEHARDPGADPALLVLVRALETEMARSEDQAIMYHRMERFLSMFDEE